jgi:hypothetical protein
VSTTLISGPLDIASRIFVGRDRKSDHCAYWRLIFMVARVAMDDRRPAGIPWNYDRGETVADGVIHAIGICFGLIGAVILIVIGSHATTGRFGHDGCIQEDVA